VTTSTPGSDQELVNALGPTATASNFMWLTPDDDHDMHNNSIASGDAYLGALVPKILGSQVFKTQKAALFIVFDEGPDATTYPNDYLYSVWAGPVVKTNSCRRSAIRTTRSWRPSRQTGVSRRSLTMTRRRRR
jgi:hypothetical protein